jgi:hypothetical protein
MSDTKAKLILAIYIKGVSLDPTEITRLLGIAPSKSQHFGQQRLTSTMLPIAAKTGLWAYFVESDTATVVDLVHQFVERFKNCTQKLNMLPNADEAYLDLFIAHDDDLDGGGEYFFELAHKDLLLLGQFGLPVRFTVASVRP